mmetsp:Transcript_14025/g.16995  ORF Transcript_14025/g.16995 Transcript_14025/m.16995 type:complete len:252 (+) Transcript_14025:114-869(+)
MDILNDQRILLLGAVVGGSQIFLALLFKIAGIKSAGLAAHKLVSLAEHTFCSVYGTYIWIYEADAIGDKAYGVLASAEVVVRANFVFQVYDLVMSLVTKELRKPEMVAHHLVTGLLAYWVLTGPYLHYFCTFFVGVAELSSIPLVFVDTCKQFPSIAKQFPTVEVVAKGLFALLFLSIRVIYWPIVSYQFWIQSLDLLNTGKAHLEYVVVTFLIANVFLTLLQQYWGTLVLKGIKRMLAGDSKGKKDKKKN